MSKFHGDLDELKMLVHKTGIDGIWTSHENNHHKFTARTGAVLNWWDTKKKTINFQGDHAARRSFEAAYHAADNDHADVTDAVFIESKDLNATRVFVVHGHDEQAREQLERILMIFGLDPFVLQSNSADGLTIIEALERQIGREPEVKFGIVLMTPDDLGYAKSQGEEKVDARARQNVVLEMGMLLSSLTRKNVVVLVKGHVELPSDANGIIYLHFNNHVKEKATQLAQRLNSSGFDISAESVTKAAV